MARKKIDLGPSLFGFPDEDLKTSLHDEIVLWLKKNAREIAIKLVNWNDAWPLESVEKERSRAAGVVEARKAQLEKEIAEGKAELEKLSAKGPIFKNQFESLSKKLVRSNRELELVSAWPGLGDPPPPEIFVETEAEHPIKRQRYQSTDIIGYLDILFSVKVTNLAAVSGLKDEEGHVNLDGDPASYMCWRTSCRPRGQRHFAFDAKSSIPSFGELIRQFRTYETYSNQPIFAVSPDSRFAAEISDERFGFIKYPEGTITLPRQPVEER